MSPPSNTITSELGDTDRSTGQILTPEFPDPVNDELHLASLKAPLRWPHLSSRTQCFCTLPSLADVPKPNCKSFLVHPHLPSVTFVSPRLSTTILSHLW